MEWIYEWIKTIAFYYIFVSIVMNALPDMKYQSYVRFFLGILLIVIMINPLLDLFRLSDTLDEQYLQEMLEVEWQEYEEQISMEIP